MFQFYTAENTSRLLTAENTGRLLKHRGRRSTMAAENLLRKSCVSYIHELLAIKSNGLTCNQWPPEARLPSTARLHIGHSILRRSHWSMQCLWKRCKHGRMRCSSPALKSSRQ